MIWLPLIAIVAITLITRLLVEIAIANRMLPSDPDPNRATMAVLLTTGIFHPLLVSAVLFTMWRGLWEVLVLTPGIELVGTIVKAVVFARVGEKRDPLFAGVTACTASVVSIAAAAFMAWLLVYVLPLLGIG